MEEKVQQLTDQVELFVLEYMKDLNGYKAAVRAGYKESTARRQASRLLARADVKARVKQEKKKVAERTGVEVEWVIKEYLKIAKGNIQDFLESGNEIKDISAIPRAKAGLIEMVKKTTTEFDGGSKTSVQIKMHSKLTALEALAKHCGFFEKDNEQKGVTITVSRVKR